MERREPRVLRGPPLDLNIGVTLPQILLQGLQNAENNTAMINAEDESRRLSYPELLDQTTRLAEVLRARGVGPGDIVTLCSENSIEFVIPVLAALFVGAAVSPLNFNYTSREFQHFLHLTTPKAVFCTPTTKDGLLEASRVVQRETSHWPSLFVLMPDAKGNDVQANGFQTLRDVVNSVPTPINFKPHVPDDPNTFVALVMCSSGTTGMPKGVEVTHNNILALFLMRTHPDFEMKTDEYYFIPCHLPMFHAIGMLISMGTVARGLALIVLPQFKFETLLRVLQDYKIPLLSAVPPMVQALAHSDVVAKYDLSHMKFMTSGAAPLSAELQDLVTARLNQVEVRQSYGLTESTLGTLMVRNGLNKSGTSGCVVPGMEAKVIDLETGQMLGPYKNGELCFRGVLTAKGYMKNPEATAQTIDKEGWLHTGDVGYYDEDECFFIVDRIKELIKYKGFQVPPAELEGVLQTHPGVADAAVVGVPNVEAGELPLAFVVRKDRALTEKEIIDFVAKNVSPQKRIRGGVRFIEAIPKTASGKILRRDLRQLLQSKM